MSFLNAPAIIPPWMIPKQPESRDERVQLDLPIPYWGEPNILPENTSEQTAEESDRGICEIDFYI